MEGKKNKSKNKKNKKIQSNEEFIDLGIEAKEIRLKINLTTIKYFNAESLLFTTYLRNKMTGNKYNIGERLEISVYGQNLVECINMDNIVNKAESILLEEERIPEEIKTAEVPEITEEISAADPSTPTQYYISKRTKFIFEPNSISPSTPSAPTIDNATSPQESEIEIGGMDKYITILEDLIELSFNTYNMSQITDNLRPKGIVIQGISGIGKTTLIKYVANKLEIKLFIIKAIQLLSLNENQIKQRLSLIKSQAEEKSIIFLDEIDSCHKELNNNTELIFQISELQKYIVSNSHQNIFIMATSTIANIHPILKKPDYVDYIVKIENPSLSDRCQILKLFFQNTNISEENIERLGNETNGFVAADLRAVAKYACFRAFVRNKDQYKNKDIEIERIDLEESVFNIKPSEIKDLLIEVPKVRWSDIGGYKTPKEQIREIIEYPQEHPEALRRMGIKMPKGILLYGPPGCSKTMIGRALATESGMKLIAIKGPSLFSKYVGSTEKAIRDIFTKARISAPCIIFFDEIDSMAMQRGGESGGNIVADRALAQLLNEIDGIGVEGDVYVLGATNRPWVMDNAILRPGRLDRLVYIGLPDSLARVDIFNIYISNMPVSQEVDIGTMALRAEGYTGAEIALICREAAMNALKENIQSEWVMPKHFDAAFKSVKPRINREITDSFQSFAEQVAKI